MAFLVRKLIKRRSIVQIADAISIEEMFADAATAEFRTTSSHFDWPLNHDWVYSVS